MKTIWWIYENFDLNSATNIIYFRENLLLLTFEDFPL